MNLLKTMLGGKSGVESLSAAEVKARLETDQPPYVLDVREADEFADGHLHDAHLIPLNQLPRRLSEVPKDREILCVCLSGARSGAAAQLLVGAGYRVINLKGGVMAWQMARYPLERGK